MQTGPENLVLYNVSKFFEMFIMLLLVLIAIAMSLPRSLIRWKLGWRRCYYAWIVMGMMKPLLSTISRILK